MLTSLLLTKSSVTAQLMVLLSQVGFFGVEEAGSDAQDVVDVVLAEITLPFSGALVLIIVAVIEPPF